MPTQFKHHRKFSLGALAVYCRVADSVLRRKSRLRCTKDLDCVGYRSDFFDAAARLACGFYSAAGLTKRVNAAARLAERVDTASGLTCRLNPATRLTERI